MTGIFGADRLSDQNRYYGGGGGVSEHNAGRRFRPAFLDSATDRVYAARHADGSPAAFHSLDGLPNHLIAARDARGRVMALQARVIVGFERDGWFFTREQAARFMAAQ